ncbi:hypothetical protein PM082_020493 [Marasmius tenuissimus]|nr:hypothetical protein PM082_020493 [Marasmius tenuissimus]
MERSPALHPYITMAKHYSSDQLASKARAIWTSDSFMGKDMFPFLIPHERQRAQSCHQPAAFLPLLYINPDIGALYLFLPSYTLPVRSHNAPTSFALNMPLSFPCRLAGVWLRLYL